MGGGLEGLEGPTGEGLAEAARLGTQGASALAPAEAEAGVALTAVTRGRPARVSQAGRASLVVVPQPRRLKRRHGS